MRRQFSQGRRNRPHAARLFRAVIIASMGRELVCRLSGCLSCPSKPSAAFGGWYALWALWPHRGLSAALAAIYPPQRVCGRHTAVCGPTGAHPITRVCGVVTTNNLLYSNIRNTPSIAMGSFRAKLQLSIIRARPLHLALRVAPCVCQKIDIHTALVGAHRQ